MDWDFFKQLARDWLFFCHENLNKFIAVLGIFLGFSLMFHAAHDKPGAGCAITLEDKLFEAGLNISTFFMGVLGTLIYDAVKTKKVGK